MIRTTAESLYLDLAALLPDTKTPRIINLESDIEELRDSNELLHEIVADLNRELEEAGKEPPTDTTLPPYPTRKPDQALGEWLQNPGNIEIASYNWKGQVTRDIQDRVHPRFCAFIGWRWGWRAMAYTLLTYRFKHGLHTILEVIGRWAPSGGADNNNVEAYAAHVSRLSVLGTSEAIDFRDDRSLRALCRAMAIHEQGGVSHIDDSELMDGVAEARADHPLVPRG